jgi:L-threonylcarbamoyladenylate synthase
MSVSTPTPILAAEQGISQAVEALRRGRLVALPTETVYGVAAWARDDDAIERLRRLKVGGRPQAFTVHVGSLEDAAPILDAAPPAARRLARRGMPGPLTLIIELTPGAEQSIAEAWGLHESQRSAILGNASVSLRCPSHAAAGEVLASVEPPVVASSVRLGSRRSAVEAIRAAEQLGDAAELVLDGGRCRYAKASTVVRFQAFDPETRGEHATFTVEREGVYDRRMIRDMYQRTYLFVCSGNTCRSPMAEAIARSMVDPDKGEDQRGEKPRVEFVSAGVMAMHGAPASEAAVAAMRDRGIDLASHRSQPLTQSLIDRADAIFTMTSSHRDAVLELAPGASEKTHRLDPDRDITDPVGADEVVYKQTAEMIEQALQRRLQEEWIQS